MPFIDGNWFSVKWPLVACGRPPPTGSSPGRMASEASASGSNSPGDELLEDMAAEEHACEPPHAETRPGPVCGIATPLPTPAPSPVPADEPAAQTSKKKRPRKPAIDLDNAIRDAAAAMKAAQKKVQEAKTQARNERRKKQRLLKKAASLNAEDLERIAVLKRCGWVRAEAAAEPKVAVPGGAEPGAGAADGASSSSAAAKAPDTVGAAT